MSNSIERYAFVTGNPNKVIEARRITGIDIKHVTLDMCEPQDRSCVNVALAKATEAYSKLRCAAIVEDSGLELVALGGFPGPLVKHWEQSGGTKTICTALDGFSDRRAVAVCVLVAIDANERIVIEARVEGTIARYPRGYAGFGFDPIFLPASISGMTFGELSGAGKDACSHRGNAWRQLLARLAGGGTCG